MDMADFLCITGITIQAGQGALPDVTNHSVATKSGVVMTAA